MLPKIKNRIFLEFVYISFFPGILIFLAKIVSILLISLMLEINFEFTPNGLIYKNTEDFIYANNLSNLITFVVVYAFGLWYLIKAYFLHDSHISPKFSIWLAVQDLSHLVSGSMGIYLRVIAYGFFIWLQTASIAMWYFFGLGSLNTLFVAFILSIIYTILATLDIERDYLIHLSYRKGGV